MPVKLKTSDESRNTTTAFAADSKLVAALDASEQYFFDVLVLFSAGATPDFKMRLAYSGTLTEARFSILQKEANNTWTSEGTPTTRPTFMNAAQITTPTGFALGGNDSASTTGGYHYRGVLTTNAAGNLSVEWAQNTSNGTDSTVKAGSYLRYDKLSEMSGTFIVKSVDESRASDTVLTVDDELTFATAANAQYVCELLMAKNCADTNPNFNQAIEALQASYGAGLVFSVGLGTDGMMSGSGVGKIHGHFQEAFLNTPTVDNSGGNSQNHRIHTWWAMAMSGSAGTLDYEWSQRVSDTDATIVQAGSWLWYEDVTP
jgi:hypothetical protein